MSFFINVGLPVLGLMALGFGMPFVWAMVLPEGIPGLAVNAALTTLVLSLVVFAWFITFYAGRHVPLVGDLLGRPGAFWPYFLRWAGKTSLIWAPMLALGIAAQPKRWKEVVW